MAKKKTMKIEAQSTNPQDLELKKILIVEDQQTVLDAYQIAMKRSGFEIFAAHDFQEAVNIYRDNAPFDILLLDMFLPNCKGFELIEHLKKNFKMTEPFIFISGEPSLETVLEAIKSGPSEYIMKPIANRELIQRILKVMEKQKLKLNAYSEMEKTIEMITLLLDKQDKDLGDHIDALTKLLESGIIPPKNELSGDISQIIELLNLFNSCLKRI